VLAEEVGVVEGQLDRVADLLDLRAQTTDVLVRDVGDLLEHELGDLAARYDLVDEAAARVGHEEVADAHARPVEGAREPHDPLVVGGGQEVLHRATS